MNGSSVRRLTALVLTVALCLSVYPCSLAAATPYCRGDVTGDGAVATNDARLLLSLLVTESAFGGQQRIAADVNGDGKANTTDVKLILDLVMNGTALPDIVEGTLEEVDLLPPSADDWMTPVQMVSNVHCTVKTADQSGGQQLLNEFVNSLALDLPKDQREEGTIATTLWGRMQGFMFFRVHNVESNYRALKMWEKIKKAGE